MESHLFSKRLNQLTKAQKQTDLDKKLEKFEIQMIRNMQRAQYDEESEKNRDKQIRDDMRKIQLNKLQRNITFMEDWQSKGQKEWEKNQMIKKERELKDREFRAKMEARREAKRLNAKDAQREDVLSGIQEFEDNAHKLGINVDRDPEQDLENTKKFEQTNLSVNATLIKLKDKSVQSELARKERDKRRRKMIVDQAKAQRDIEIKKKEQILIDKLAQQSKQENEIGYEVWRAQQGKHIIVENRKIRELKYQRKEDDQIAIAQSKEEHLLHQYKQEVKREIDFKQLRQRELEIEHQSKNRKSNYSQCKEMLEYIYNIADLCYEHLQDTDQQDIDPRFWRDCCNLFKADLPLLPRRTFRDKEGTKKLTEEKPEKVSAKMYMCVVDIGSLC